MFNELYDEKAARGRKAVAKVSEEAAQGLEEISESARPTTDRQERKAPVRSASQTKSGSRAQRRSTASRDCMSAE
ncbi:hypothetical protein [Planotetraspora phitsanulokensis]|nr:hypothetical protein [Planotetraspora phitsanulokensis]